MKILMKRIICLLVWAFFFLCTIPPCVSGICTYYGLQDAKLVEGNDRSPIQEGEIVKVIYDCAFSGYLTTPSVGKGGEQFQRLRVSGSDECLLICLDSKANHELQTSGHFFLRTADAVEFTPERKYVLAGRVEKMTVSDREALRTSMLHGTFADPEGVERTQMEYFIRYIDAETAKETMLKNYVWTAIGAAGTFFCLLAFLGRLKKIRYGLVPQRENREEDSLEDERRLEK